ncbi:hypothetical protein M1N67_03725 [Peptococcaceae bacterium]|nr:hypothetical protein [Peptococcaceae bacterium]
MIKLTKNHKKGEKKINFQAELARLREKKTLLEGKNYYIPHQNLLKVKKHLEKKNIFVVLGSEWLAAQNQKQAYLKNQPFLPFSIIVEENQINTIKNTIKKCKDLTCDIPILFLIKNDENLKPFKTHESFLSVLDGHIFVYQPNTLEIYTSSDEFLNFIDQLDNKINKTEENLEHLQKSEEEIFF